MPEGTIRRNVLVIAYYFPPLGLSGVQRTLKFVKYLPEYGWQPTVLTVEPSDWYPKDESFLDELKDIGIRIVRTHSRDILHLKRKKKSSSPPREWFRILASNISQTFMQPDNKIGWKKFALQAADDLIREPGAPTFDAILATAPPYTDFLIGEELKRRYRIPLVVDYRDAWVGNPFNFYATPFHRAYAAKLEANALRSSDNIVVVHRKIKELLIRGYSFLGFEDVKIIPHGYDQEDFTAARKMDDPPPRGKMRITHAGIFYEKGTPRYFLEALAQVFERHPETRDKIEACFVGQFRKEHLKLIRRPNLYNAVQTTGYLPHRQCVKYLLDSDVLWMMMFDTLRTPGKVFEYIGARKPIIASAPEGVVRQVLSEYGAAQITAPADVPAIADAIYQYYVQWKEHRLPVPDESFVQSYDRRSLTQELAKTLESVAPL
jgi:glycosyltransferase involved in cell wall biosynthesis